MFGKLIARRMYVIFRYDVRVFCYVVRRGVVLKKNWRDT